MQTEKHEERKRIENIESVEHEGQNSGADKCQHISPIAILRQRNHQREACQKIARKEQRRIQRPDGQGDRGNRAGDRGERYFIGGNFFSFAEKSSLTCTRSKG